MFINVVIIRVILFCAGVPPSPSLVSRNATSFVSLLRKVPRPSSALLFLSFFACVREKEKREREKETVYSSHPSFLPPFPSFSFFLSFSHRADPSCLRAAVSIFPPLSFSLSFYSFDASSRVLHGVIAHGSLLGLAHFPPLPRQRRFFPPVYLLGVSFFSFWSSCSPAGGFPPEFTSEHLSPWWSPPPPLRFTFLFPRSFLSLSIADVLRSSHLNAGRTNVSYRLRK